MMKKRNEEGYVLVYVMVVVFVLCAIALALMSGTLRTLQAQEAMVQRMKDKYEAMGEIERFTATLEDELSKNAFSYSGSNYDTPSAAYAAAKDAINEIVSLSSFSFFETNSYFSELPSFSSSALTYKGKHSYDVTSSSDNTGICAVISVSFNIELEDNTKQVTQEDLENNITSHPPNHCYRVTLSSPVFSHYEVRTSGTREEGGDST